MDNEANWTSNNSPPKDWPSSGSVTFSDYGKGFFVRKNSSKCDYCKCKTRLTR